MPASSRTHTFTKRSVDIGPPLIAVIVVVVVLFNLILAVSWCFLRDRKKLNNTHKRRISAPLDVEKYEHSVAFAVTTGALRAPVASKEKGDAQGAENGKSYYELIRAIQLQTNSPTPLSQVRQTGPTAETATLSKFVLRPQDIKELNGVPIYPKAKGQGQSGGLRRDVMLGVPARAELKRANSLADTASVYSSASAPLEYHEHLFKTQPFALEPPPPASAPAWVSELPKPPLPAKLSYISTAQGEVTLPSPTGSEASADIPLAYRSNTLSSGPTSPISVPSSSTLSLVRPRTHSNPSAPPQVHWLAPKEDPSTRSKRPNSTSSLSTIFSLQEATRVSVVTPVTIAPLNIRRRSDESRWGSVDLTRSTPLSSPSLVAPAPQVYPNSPVPQIPTVPVRSPKRPPVSASVEHLPS